MDSSVSRIPSGIRFGDYLFSYPVPLGHFTLPLQSAGLYVILLPDSTWGPWNFQPLYFGEFGFQRQAHMSAAQQTFCFKVAGGRVLYCAFYVLPNQQEWQISRIKRELIERYRPVSNMDSMESASELTFNLNSVERKIAEQEAVLRFILAAIGQIVQFQQPEPKKRIAGFRRDPTDSATAADRPHLPWH
jgi:hypothetical protein